MKSINGRALSRTAGATDHARWLVLPPQFDPSTHVALSVAGNSMAPFLNDGDTVLVDTRKAVTRGCIVVAKLAGENYVTKHVTRCGKRTLHMSSLNSKYPPFTIERETIIGVVVARLQPEGQAA